MHRIRQITVIDQETRREGDRDVDPPTRKVAACAVLQNPLAGRPGTEAELAALVDLSVEVGAILTERALRLFGPGEEPRAYSKGVIVGTAGDREHGAAMIHVRMGLSMRRGLGTGPALIPGTKKVAGPGASIDLVFGGIEDAWDYDAMDAVEVSVPGAPKPDEIVLVAAFASGGRPNARIRGASPAEVAELVRQLGRP